MNTILAQKSLSHAFTFGETIMSKRRHPVYGLLLIALLAAATRAEKAG